MALFLTDNTVVVLVGDHGFHLGNQNIFGKQTLFERSTRIPLILKSPGTKLRGGQSSNSIVELIDLFPTLADLCGLEPPVGVDGVSLKPILLKEKKEVKTMAFTSYDPFAPSFSNYFGTSMVTDNYRFTLWQDKFNDYQDISSELYDYKINCEELRNVSDSKDYDDVQTNLQKKLYQHLLNSRKGYQINDDDSINKSSKYYTKVTLSNNPSFKSVKLLYSQNLEKIVVKNESGKMIMSSILDRNGGIVINTGNWTPDEYEFIFYDNNNKPIISKKALISSSIYDY